VIRLIGKTPEELKLDVDWSEAKPEGRREPAAARAARAQLRPSGDRDLRRLHGAIEAVA